MKDRSEVIADIITLVVCLIIGVLPLFVLNAPFYFK
jgi:hypothetical protein